MSIPLPADVETAAIGLVTYLRCSEDVPQGADALCVHLVSDREVYDAPLRAGIETAETGLFDPELRARAKHQPAGIFGDSGSGSPLTYFARVDLRSPVRAGRLEVRAQGPEGRRSCGT